MVGDNQDFTQRYKYMLGFESSDITPYAHVQTENIESEVEASEISLKSFKKKNHLADKLWDGTELDLRVRSVLMDIADDFWEFCNIRWVKPSGVILTGSICNYNWSEFSDIDLHLIVDFSKIHDRVDFVQEYFNDKKNEWNNTHKSLEIYGFPVELYVQDVDAEMESGGVYDLWENKWVKEPNMSDLKPIELNKYRIKYVAADIMTKIDDLVSDFKRESDRHKIEEIGDVCNRLNDSIREIRKMGLKKGEMGTGNIVYKCLRRSGHLSKLWKLMDKIYDKLNSIEESHIFAAEVSKQFF